MIEIPLDAIPRPRKKRKPMKATFATERRPDLTLEMALCLRDICHEIIGKERARRHTINAG